MKRYLSVAVTTALLVGSAAGLHWIFAKERAKPNAAKPAAQDAAPPPKPLSANVQKGLQWLVAHQQENGGWGQGEESPSMGQDLGNLKDTANVADTGVATLALLRAGSTPGRGSYQANVRRAVDFICRAVEQSDEKSLYVTEVRGTRVQAKLGTYIDTFFAALILAEVRNQMPDEAGKKRVAAALDKVMHKIETNQKDDGTWANAGWAPVLAQGVAGKAINRAAQEGARVDEKVRERVEMYARSNVGAVTGGGVGGGSGGGVGAGRGTGIATGIVAGSAGVPLYSTAATVGVMQDSDNTNGQLEKELKQKAAALPAGAPERQAAQAKLRAMDGNKHDLDLARSAVVDKLDDRQFMAGFGSNGGEEFLSYLSLGESLVAKGGAEWAKWDRSMTENLNRIQNNDGSWTGHHCITGRTFCTAAALLVLTVDRAPAPVADKLQRRP